MKKLTKSKVWYAVSMMLLLIAVLICVQNIITFSTEEIDAAILDGQYCLDAKVDSKYNIEEVSNALLGDVSIAKCEYLYSLDDSADYIYVEFENGGYAIYLKQTMEMLEYSAKGTLKYAGFTSKKYYGGPNIYLVKDNDSFFDTVSNQEIKISRESAKIYSSAIRDKLLINYNMRTELNSTEYDYSLVDYDNTGFEINKTESGLSVSKPNLDTNSLIIIPEDDGTYIPNYRYFLHDPTHGWNSTGTCGAVAAQILLSYHNYYTDRRIINNRYLNGDIINKNANPNLCVDPMIMTSHTLGTRGSREDGSDDPNSYFAYIVKKIPANATTSQMVNGIKGVFSERNGEIDATINYSIDSKIGNKIVDTGKVKSEIDCGRPAILLMQKSLGGADHYVVAYGYCNYDYHNSSDSYSGFITHFGWTSNEINVWINSAWCYSYITLNINHEHDLTKKGIIDSNPCRIESKCITCGYRTDADIKILANESYVERTATLPQNGYTYKDYIVSFESAGFKTFQTFGAKDAKLYLYNMQDEQLVFNDDSGYVLNAFFTYSVKANIKYRLRVQFFDKNTIADVKIGIMPVYRKFGKFEDIGGPFEPGVTAGGMTNKDYVYVMRCCVKREGSYVFYTQSRTDNYTDMILYLIDPTSTKIAIFDDDSAANLQARITILLKPGIEYLLIATTFDIRNTGQYDVYFKTIE